MITRANKIQTGELDGVTVIADPDNQRYLVDLPNSYDVYWLFNSKDEKHAFAKRVEQPDIKRAIYEIPIENLATDEQIKSFTYKVKEARETAKAITSEREAMESVLSFNQAHDNKTVAFIYKAPTKGFAVGEILHSGKYFVAQSAGENDDKVFVRVIHSTKLLQGKEEFANREETLKEKFPVGSHKYLRYDEQGRISAKDYQPKQVAKAENPTLTEDQRAALRAYSEKNGQAWKEKLNVAWTTGSYKGLHNNQSALLQQVRNQLGPEWLAQLKTADLYPETAKQASVAKPKATAQSR